MVVNLTFGCASLFGAQTALADHWLSSMFRADYAGCLAELNRFAEARTKLESAHATLVDRFGAEDYRVAAVLASMSALEETHLRDID